MSVAEGKSPKRLTALVAGATGAIGKHVVIQLLLDENWEKVVTVTRRNYDYKSIMIDEDAYNITNDVAEEALTKLEENIVDFDSLENEKQVFSGQTALFSCMGTTIKAAGSQEAQYRIDVELPHQIAQLAKAAGTKQIHLVSSIGADSTSSTFYTRMKGEMEEMTQKLEMDQCSIYQPSLLLTPREESRPGEAFAQWMAPAFNAMLFGSMKKYKAIRVEDVAAAMVFEATRVAMGSEMNQKQMDALEMLKENDRYDDGASVTHVSDVIQAIADASANE